MLVVSLLCILLIIICIGIYTITYGHVFDRSLYLFDIKFFVSSHHLCIVKSHALS